MSITPIREKWKGTMTERERFNNQMNYKSFDRSFNMEFGYWDENYKTWKCFLDNGITSEWQANQFFNFDRIDGVWEKVEIHPGFQEKIISETDTHYIMQNSEGLIGELSKTGGESIPRFERSSIQTPDDWKRVKELYFDINHPDRKVDIAALKAIHGDDATRDYPLGIYCGSMIGKIRNLLTFEGLCYAVYDYPDMVEDMVETHCQLVENCLDQVLPYFQFDYASGWEDICFKNGPIVSPDFFKNVIMPRLKRIGDKLKAAGIKIWYTDCDGDVRPLLPYMMEAGINCLFPFEVNGCSHPAELMAEYKGELRIMGGIDKIQLKAGKDEIKAYLKSVEKLVADGGYIPFCDHRCPPDVSEENYFYYLDLKERMFGIK
ncbi:MAG: hypothetical protein IJF54_06375 [Clostridia bacterium]|nr:hypothetical protein [Clostridia bacterium]